jgi:hypothetical protein
MSLGTDRERQFDDILDAAGGDSNALRDAARRVARHDLELSADLDFVARLSGIMPSRAEIDSARLAVGQRLASAILAGAGEEAARNGARKQLRRSEPEPYRPGHDGGSQAASASAGGALIPPTTTTKITSTEPIQRTSSPPAALPRRAVTRGRVFLSAVAAVIALIALGAALTALSASSLPESPLYSVKRAEESVLLAFPLDGASQARVLSMVALRRLTEAQDEAIVGRDREAEILLDQFNDDVRQMIRIAAKASGNASERRAITMQIANVLKVQDVVRNEAQTRGNAAFSQALSASAVALATTLQQSNVTLPSADNNSSQYPNGSSGGMTPQPNATPATPSPGGPNASPSPSPGQPTPTVCPGHGKGHGGSGSASCGGSGSSGDNGGGS